MVNMKVGQRIALIAFSLLMISITVVAAFLPAFADAVEMKYGTPIPLAAPIRKDPSSVPGIAFRNWSSRYPTKNISGATTLVLLPSPFFSFG